MEKGRLDRAIMWRTSRERRCPGWYFDHTSKHCAPRAGTAPPPAAHAGGCPAGAQGKPDREARHCPLAAAALPARLRGRHSETLPTGALRSPLRRQPRPGAPGGAAGRQPAQRYLACVWHAARRAKRSPQEEAPGFSELLCSDGKHVPAHQRSSRLVAGARF